MAHVNNQFPLLFPRVCPCQLFNLFDQAFAGLLQVVAFNRTVEKVDHFMQNEAKGSKVIGVHSVEEMIKKLKKPRRIMVSFWLFLLFYPERKVFMDLW